MSPFTIMVSFIILLWILVRTASYGIWTWRNKNKLGAVAIFFTALAAVVLPIYVMFYLE